ncbi:MAG: ribosome small subunit-dependent GTPase A [Armatimonadota bacterium]
MQAFIGTIVRTDGSQVTVRDAEAREWRCVLRGRLRRMLAGATNPLAVGDRVEVKPAGSWEGTVEKLLPRRSRLARRAVIGHDAAHRGKGARRPPREHVLAANLDLVVVVVAAPPRPAVIDRYLALAARGGCSALVCVNKIDLVDTDAAAAIMAPYGVAGVPVLLTSAVTGEGTEGLRAALAGKLVAFVGPSGGGKSSLLNVLNPRLNLRTGGLSVAGKGSHTTNWSATFTVGDGLVVDTPGLREIGFLEDEGREATEDLFPEITALVDGCRFRDCTHTHEPRCAVKSALDAGVLDPDLYRRYARLTRSGRI